ncbi:hypothetical protein LPJ58_004131 [Coemansia sp. RSA 1591]|nr:hypothetical protein LPJ58_004131 [Coemansia sp. RSA 1591]
MPIMSGHKTLSSLLHLGSSKADGRTAFSPYTGSLTGSLNAGRGTHSETETMVGTPSMNFGTSIAINVRYVAKDMWRKVTFPPGITVTQARDICMLRFNVWQQTLAHETDEQAGSEPKSRGAPPIMPAGSQSTTSRPELREQYGLFWTSAGHWLETDEMLNAYPLRKGEVLELQHTVNFIPLQPHEFKYSYAESFVYYLCTDGAALSWQLCWAVLRGRVLRLHRHKTQSDPDAEIDLARPFRLTDQDKRSWPRSSKSGRDSGSTSALFESLPSAPSNSSGGVLIVQTVGGGSASTTTLAQAAAQVHVLRTCDVFDYDVWHRTLRTTLSGAASGSSSSMSASASISGASNTSGGVPMDTPVDSDKSSALSILSPQINQRFRPSSTRHEGYVNRKSPHGYGFRRRCCVLLPTMLYGFIHADDSKDSDMLSKCDFAISLDPSTVTVEAIAWNGRFLLRVFAPNACSVRDKPAQTAMNTEDTLAHCTDILATAAQAAIEQHGSSFGILPDARELVRLMIDDGEEGQAWAVGFNSIAGLQITGQSKVIISARRGPALAETKSHVNLKPSEFHTMPVRAPPMALNECDELSELDTLSSPGNTSSPGRIAPPGKQQSLSEFFVSQMDPSRPTDTVGLGIQPLQPPPPPAPAPPTAEPTPKPKWIPLSIEKYVQEEEEEKKRQASRSSSSATTQGLQPKPSNVSDHDLNFGEYARPPARFNWFKRRGSTSK